MKRLIHAFAMCRSMFCAIPSPWKVWDEEARPLMLLCLPVLGLEIGLIWAAVAWLGHRLHLPEPIFALMIALYPFAVTGGLHLDGFMDVTDAMKSYRSLERRREILKDSHVGAFAVVGVGMLLLAQYAAASCLEGEQWVLILIPVVSRCGSALAVMLLKPMSTSQYATQNIQKRYAPVVWGMLALALVFGSVLMERRGLALLGGIAGYLWALRRGYKSLEGMNGDISGYALTISELCALVTLAVIS